MSLDAMYSEKSASYFGAERRDMLPFVPDGISSLLDVGCSTGAFGAMIKTERGGCRVVGIEPHGPSARAASQRLDHVEHGTFPPDEAMKRKLGRFDCITFNDVLEHLVDPWGALSECKGLLNPGGVVVASIPNVRNYTTLKRLVFDGEWEYKERGILDRTHLRFFTPASMRTLFERSGFRVETIAGLDWAPLPRWLAVVNRLTARRFRDLSTLQFACVARPLA